MHEEPHIRQKDKERLQQDKKPINYPLTEHYLLLLFLQKVNVVKMALPDKILARKLKKKEKKKLQMLTEKKKEELEEKGNICSL